MSDFVPGFSPPADVDEPCYVVVSEGRLLMGDDPMWRPLDQAAWRFAGLVPREQHYIGLFGSRPVYAVDVAPDAVPPPSLHWVPLRALIGNGAIGAPEFDMVGCALQVFNWDRSHQYCGQCGSPTVAHLGERARVCERCALHYYPRISPCVIVLITRGNECLLARHKQSRGNFYTALAGFVEPGESVEAALRREVAEEVALQVRELQYFGSQTWPFPGQLMLGFHAEYDHGDIAVDDEEIADARWYHYENLPLIPPAGTLSGMLIKHFVDSRNR
ncbi:NAD(+) diphosphatase [Gilvimarinus sp. F26214L]|uniref:NAD(+) diphosphatase n=1 Tax=Gilvimarinus sp. DZF01 TaxID=3461371 RepID=UPI0040460DF3